MCCHSEAERGVAKHLTWTPSHEPLESAGRFAEIAHTYYIHENRDLTNSLPFSSES